MVTFVTLFGWLAVPMQLVPEGSRTVVFRRIYTVFLMLGTLVSIVVVAYMLQKAYKYRASAAKGRAEGRPELGELPSGGGGGRKLFLSFSLSAIIVVSLITWTYFALVDVERTQPAEAENALNVQVEGFQFGWAFVYPNGNTSDTLRVPEDRMVKLTVTSRDVFHNFGIPAFKMKTDAIPGQTTDTWFRPNETGTYQAQCFELCGAGHSAMNANVSVMESGAYEQWYANTTPANTTSGNATGNNTTATDASATADNATAANNGTTAA
jgi:cytochrome c oxidase, subunit II